MKIPPFELNGKLWLYNGKGAWHFITIEKSDAQAISDEYIWPRKGFGSIPVSITLGSTTWNTSIFPEKKGTFLLPIKKSVRDKEGISEGDKVSFILTIVQ